MRIRVRFTREHRFELASTTIKIGIKTSLQVVLNLCDRAVLYKPPGWEVHDEHLPKQLRTFAAEPWDVMESGKGYCNFK